MEMMISKQAMDGLIRGRRDTEFICSQFQEKDYQQTLKQQQNSKKNFKILLMKKIYETNKFITWVKLVCTLDCFQKRY